MTHEIRHWAEDEGIRGDENAAHPPLWALFALDPPAARLIITATENPDKSKTSVADEPSGRIRAERAALLADFLEGRQEDKEFMFERAAGFLRPDQKYSQLDIPASSEENTN